MRSRARSRLPAAYFALGYAALATALLIAALRPASIDTFFFQPRVFAVVHLVTLGWLTHSLLGATYAAAPLALGTSLPARRGDGWACAGVAVGASGVVSHFWIEEYSGVAYSGGLLLLVFAWLAGRVLRALREAPLERSGKALLGAGYANLVLAAIVGTMLAIDKHHPFLPGDHLRNVYGHAHAGLVGWGLLVVMGFTLRTLPVALPAPPPAPRRVWILLFLTEGGMIGLGTCWMTAPSWARAPALLVALGVAWFAWLVIDLVRRAPRKRLALDAGLLHLLQAAGYLALATGTGLYLVFREPLDLAAAMVYGTFVLLGFFGHLLVGAGALGLPARGARPLRWTALALWTIGVPVLAFGLARARDAHVSAGSWSVLGGTAAAALSLLESSRRTPNGERQT